MRFIGIIFLFVFIAMIILSPFLELIGIFIEMSRINAMVITSSRLAIQEAIEEENLMDGKIEVNFEKFKEEFIHLVNVAMQKEVEIDMNPKYRNEDGILLNPVMGDDGEDMVNSCEIYISSEYQFKTKILQKFTDYIEEKYILKVNRVVTLRGEN